MRFRVKLRGYEIKEVDRFIAETQAKNDAAFTAQKERIASLKQQNESLGTELAVLKSREEQIKLTLLKATKTADELNEQIKQRYKEELERLKLFRAKWTAAYEEIKDRYHFSKDALSVESVAVQIELDLTKYLTQEFSLNRGEEIDDMEAYFRSEVERLTRIQQSMQEEPVKNRAKKQTLEEEGAFSLEEALHPTDSLEDICKSLGM